MLNIPYLRELCEKAPPFVVSAIAREALPELLDRVRELERVATEARYYLLHGGRLDDLERALRAAGYGG